MVRTVSSTLVQSADFTTIDNAGTTLRISGLTRTNTAQIDNPGGGLSPQGVGPPDEQISNVGPQNVFLGPPDVWLIINVNGSDYQFPGYTAE